MAEILGIDENIIKIAADILSVISSTGIQDINSFENTLKLFHSAIRMNFPTISITPTIHFVICHEPAVLRYLGKRTEHLSEEAQERTNKILRSSRLNHTRKISPFSVKEDLSHWLFQRSYMLSY